MYMYHSFLIHLSADGHLGCFHVLAMINSAAMNIGVHVSLSDLVSSVCMPRSGISGSYGSSISENCILNSHVIHTSRHEYIYKRTEKSQVFKKCLPTHINKNYKNIFYCNHFHGHCVSIYIGSVFYNNYC